MILWSSSMTNRRNYFVRPVDRADLIHALFHSSPVFLISFFCLIRLVFSVDQACFHFSPPSFLNEPPLVDGSNHNGKWFSLSFHTLGKKSPGPFLAFIVYTSDIRALRTEVFSSERNSRQINCQNVFQMKILHPLKVNSICSWDLLKQVN